MPWAKPYTDANLNVTKPQLRALQHVERQSKGWPVGIPTQPRVAKRLVAQGLAEWAPPFWRYPKPVHSIRLTSMGRVLLAAEQHRLQKRPKPSPGLNQCPA